MPFKDINEVFEAFGQQRVLIIGDVMIDAYIYGSTERISPEAPVPIVHVKRKENRLGGAANVALNIQALGAQPILCSLIGDDVDGKEFIRLLNEQNISSKGIIQSANRSTTIKHRVLAGSQQMLRIDEESDHDLDQIEENSLIEHIKKLLNEVDLVIFEDYDKGTLNERIISETIAVAKDLAKPVIVDPKKKNFNFYRGVTLFKPNLKELVEGLKIDLTSISRTALDEVIDQFKSKNGHEKVMTTLSDKGIYINGESGSTLIDAHVRRVADVSGAGDTVVSISGLCVALGLPDRFSAELANLGGGLVCEYLGISPIDKTRLTKEAKDLKID